ncbi:MAG: hypothetical protein ACLTER_19475 [Ruminococcus sp.]
MRSFVQSPLSMPGILHRMYLQYDAAKDHCGLRTDSLDPGCRNGKDHLDSDVRAAIGSYDIFDPGLPALSVLEPGKLILEVKFTEMLPQLLRDVLPPPAAEFTAVSKYVLCYEKTRYMNGFEYWYET